MNFGLVFVVFVPATIISRHIARQHYNLVQFWRFVQAGCPPWMRWGLAVLFGYAAVDLVAFMIANTVQTTDELLFCPDEYRPTADHQKRSKLHHQPSQPKTGQCLPAIAPQTVLLLAS